MKIDELNASLNVSRVTPFTDKIIQIENKKNRFEYGFIRIPSPSNFELGAVTDKGLSIEFLEDVIKVMKEIMSDQDVKLAEGGK